MDSKAEEITKLIYKTDQVEDEKYKMVKEIAQMDARKAELLKLCDEKHIALVKLKTKQDKLDNFISQTLQDSKSKISNLEICLKELEARKVEAYNQNKSNP